MRIIYFTSRRILAHEEKNNRGRSLKDILKEDFDIPKRTAKKHHIGTNYNHEGLKSESGWLVRDSSDNAH